MNHTLEMIREYEITLMKLTEQLDKEPIIDSAALSSLNIWEPDTVEQATVLLNKHYPKLTTGYSLSVLYLYFKEKDTKNNRVYQRLSWWDRFIVRIATCGFSTKWTNL